MVFLQSDRLKPSGGDVLFASRQTLKTQTMQPANTIKHGKDNPLRIFAPATIANIGCGFDIMGMTLEGVGDEIEIAVSEGSGIVIRNDTDIKLPGDIEKNVMTPALRAMLATLGEDYRIEITVIRKILPGSGIGSSAAASSAAVTGLNECLGCPCGEKQLVIFAMEGERLVSGGTAHADNVGPAITGGIMLIRGYDPLDYVKIPAPASLYVAVIHPHITVSTLEGRAVMPKEIPLRTAVAQWGNVGGLVAGLLTGDLGLVSRSIRDAVAEPCRKQFIPGYDDLKEKIVSSGALASNIAGSGPSVFALCDSAESAQTAGKAMKEHFDSRNIESDLYVSKISDKGARVIGGGQ